MASFLNANVPNVSEMVGECLFPGKMSFNLTRTEITRRWYWQNPNQDGTLGFTSDDLEQILWITLGTTQPEVNTAAPGRLNRQLPLADPLFGWAYASSFNNIEGIGSPVSKQPALPSLAGGIDNSLPAWTLFPNYQLDITCTTRPYPVLPDSSIIPSYVIWVDIAGSTQQAQYYPEWRRFCSFTQKPMDDWIARQNLTAYYKTSDNSEPGSSTQPAQFMGQQRLLMPDYELILRWDGVPMRYLTSSNSYLNKFRGFVNQNPWSGPNEMTQLPSQVGNTFTYGAGSLLYDGCDIIDSYPPVVPFIWPGGVADYGKLCDFALRFRWTTRVTQKAPTKSGNTVWTGWNSLPYFPNGLFYAAYNKDLAGNIFPMFPSFPVELMFTDPDAPGAYTGNG